MRIRLFVLATGLALAANAAAGTNSALPGGPDGAAWRIGPEVPAAGELTAGTQAPDSSTLVTFGVGPDGRTFAHTMDSYAPVPALMRVPVPNVGRVHDADGEWAVAGTAALHYENGRWVRHAFAKRAGTQLHMRDIAAGPGEAWAVGTETVPGTRTSRGIVQHWDGSAWRILPVADGLLDGSSALTTLYLSDRLTVFGIDHDATRGEQAIALQFDGTGWSRVRLPTRAGWVDTIDDTAAPAMGVGWTAPIGAPHRRRPLAYTLDFESGRWVRVEAPGKHAQLTAAASDYGIPLAIGNTTDGRLYATRVNTDDSGRSTMLCDEVPPIRGAVFDTTGSIRHQLWAFGYRSTAQGRKPLLLSYESQFEE